MAGLRYERKELARSVLHVALAVLRAAASDWKGNGMALLTPVFLLLVFWIVSGDGDGDGGKPALLPRVFPGIVGLTAMLGGQAALTRVLVWRQMGVFHRLACTPTPPGGILLGLGAAHAALSTVQALLVLLFGAAFIGLPVSVPDLPAATGIIACTAACFVAAGLGMSALSRNPEAAGSTYVFALISMYFLGSGLFDPNLPRFLQQLSPALPTALVQAMMDPLIAGASRPAAAYFGATAGLAAYIFLFASLAFWRFRWE